MKKLILIAGAAVLIASCQKQKNGPEPAVATNNSGTVLSITKLSDSYIQDQMNKNNPDANAKKLPKWLKVLAADLVGALDGAYHGGAIGTTFPGIGTTVGAIGGAIIEGAGASIIAGSGGGGGYPTNTGGVQPTPNQLNSFDRVGMIHYLVVAQANNNLNTIFPNGVFNRTAYFNMTFQIMQNNNINLLQYQQNFSTLTIPELNFEKNLSALTNYVDQTVADPTVNDILKDYFKALDNTNDAGDFSSYSIQAENSVTNSNLSADQKTILLSVMSTARYGVAYYD